MSVNSVDLPYHQTDFHEAEAVYEELAGWGTSLADVTESSDLPTAARAYLDFLEDQVGVPISLVGVGPARRQSIEYHSAA